MCNDSMPPSNPTVKPLTDRWSTYVKIRVSGKFNNLQAIRDCQNHV